jgi:hypothetical protein
MGELILLQRYIRKPAPAHGESQPKPAPPTGKIIGTCDLCKQPAAADDVFYFTDRVTHWTCLERWNTERGWDASRLFMFHTLAWPFADALGKEQVKPLILQFQDDATHYVLAFEILNCLQRMLRDAPVATEKRAKAEQALAACKEQLRQYVRPLP